jgi:hypothetical protein
VIGVVVMDEQRELRGFEQLDVDVRVPAGERR